MEAQALAGVAACLASACGWALCLVLFEPLIARFGSWAVNFGKNAFALVLVAATLTLGGAWGALATAPAWAVVTVALSGVVGLSLGDTALFASIHRIGVYRTLLLQTAAPVFAAILAMAFQGERLSAGQTTGALLVLAGVALVLRPRAGDRGAALTAAGLSFALASALAQGAGVVMAKAGLGEMVFLTAAFWRLAGGVAGLVPLLVLTGRVGAARRLLGSRRSLAALALPSFFGTYLTILLMMAGVALTPAAVAAVLLSMTPVFSLFVEARQRGELPSPRGFLGTLLAVAGVGWLSVG